MKKALLTIAIPTFNENHKLDLQIERLLSQCRNLPVKIRIFDNNPFSDFDNEKYPLNSFDYLKNPDNLGGDRNIFSCILNCNTEYLWILSTNDLIKFDSIVGLMNEINIAQLNDCCFVHMGQKKCCFTTGIDEFVTEIVYEDSFTISRCIYNVRMLKEKLIDYYAVIKSNQGQAYFIFSFLSQKQDGKCYFTNFEPIERYLPSEWSKMKFIKNTLGILPFYKTLFRNNKHLFNTIKNKIQNMLYFQLFISRSYQRMNVFYFVYYFFKINSLGVNNISKAELKIFIVSVINFEYYKKLRQINWDINEEDDFKSHSC